LTVPVFEIGYLIWFELEFEMTIDGAKLFCVLGVQNIKGTYILANSSKLKWKQLLF